MGNFYFYSVVGANGVAVMDSWEGVQKIRTYIRKAAVKGFYSFREAEDWTLMLFEDRFARVGFDLLSLQVNQAVFIKKMQQEYEV